MYTPFTLPTPFTGDATIYSGVFGRYFLCVCACGSGIRVDNLLFGHYFAEHNLKKYLASVRNVRLLDVEFSIQIEYDASVTNDVMAYAFSPVLPVLARHPSPPI
jgi:hypothetical protein